MKLLLTGACPYTEAQLSALRALGADLVFQADERGERETDFGTVEAVVCNGLFLTHPPENFPALRFIQATSAGLDRLPLAYIEEHNIELHNARGVYSVPMAEWAVSAVLSLYKHTGIFLKNQKNHLWDKDRTVRELAGDTVCIIGCGSVGTECAKRFQAFGTKVIAADIVRPPSAYYNAYYPMDDLERAVAHADVTVLTLPLTDSTRGLVDANLLQKMKQGAILVNIARGAIVKEDDLINALQSGGLGGAVLDVFEEEPLSESSPLWDMENVLVTPHNSFVSPKNNERLFQLIYNNLKEFTEKGAHL